MSSINKAYYALLTIALVLLLQPSGGTWAWLMDTRWLYVLLVAFITAQLVTPVTIRLGWRMNIVDRPDHDRKLQPSPVPRVGGIAVFTAILLATLRNFQFSPELNALMLGSLLMLGLGMVDDIRPLPAYVRLLVQIAASLIVVNGGVVISFIPAHWGLHGPLTALLTIIWLIGMTNAINFMDGIDGLCTSMIAVCAALFFLITAHSHQHQVSFLLIALIGGCLGFLPYNWRPASVYLGDGGSTFLGFLLSGLAIMGSWAENNALVAVSTPLLILAIPIFDMIYTTLSRIKNGSVSTFRQWLEFTGRDHFHHRLLHLTLTVEQTVAFIIAVNLCLGLAALALRDTGSRGSLLLLAQTVIIFGIIVVLMLLGRTLSEDKKEDQRK